MQYDFLEDVFDTLFVNCNIDREVNIIFTSHTTSIVKNLNSLLERLKDRKGLRDKVLPFEFDIYMLENSIN